MNFFIIITSFSVSYLLLKCMLNMVAGSYKLYREIVCDNVDVCDNMNGT